jgi:hypothetical protein
LIVVCIVGFNVFRNILFSTYIFILIAAGSLMAQTPEKYREVEKQPLSELSAYPDYPVAGKRTGVWNNGQAALWDLDIIDYFRLFGAPERARGYKPEQPIKFSHVVHVQKNRMDCTYCHWNVAKSSYAAIPSVDTCMGCHAQVKAGDKPEWAAEIEKLTEYFNKGEQIPWVKVHVMPAYVRFNHKRHVKAGVACHECHGQVGEMPVVERVSSMKMGWCIDCHRARGASIDCYTCHY